MKIFFNRGGGSRGDGEFLKFLGGDTAYRGGGSPCPPCRENPDLACKDSHSSVPLNLGKGVLTVPDFQFPYRFQSLPKTPRYEEWEIYRWRWRESSKSRYAHRKNIPPLKSSQRHFPIGYESISHYLMYNKRTDDIPPPF